MIKAIKNGLSYVCSLGFALLLFSCQPDLLDQVPKDSLSELDVWEDPYGAEQFVNAIYGSLESGFDRNHRGNGEKGTYLWDSLSDDAECAMGWVNAQTFNNGNIAAAIGAYNPYPLEYYINYRLIRKTNLALENLDRLPAGNEDLRDRLKGEVYFLRAFVNFQLLTQYGYKPKPTDDPNFPTGIILLDRTLTPDDDWMLTRNTYTESIEFIADDLDRAADMLPGKAGIQAGRATKGAAMALKSRVMLYAASPYTSGTEFLAADYSYLERSIEAAEAVIDGGEYSLFGDYRTLFLTENKNNSEIIFAKKFNAPEKYHFGLNQGWDEINSPRVFKGAGDAGWNGNCPTQEFVDSYEMTDGLSQLNSTMFDPTDPYANLDPRFDATVVHHGSTFRGLVIEIQEGGSGDAGADSENSPTGYWVRKYHEEQYPVYTHSSDLDWIFIRYAEVLLNYAEAVNELNGPTTQVYDAINQIRDRASVKMPPLPGGLSKEQMRMKIRNERRVELAFEEHRLFDIERWGIAPDLLNGPIHGVTVTGSTGNFTFVKKVVETRVFPEKQIVFPVPTEETQRNPNLKQVGGW